MKIPSFRHQGGKARLRKWLIQHFPINGDTYYEPFAGKGNVFFLSKTLLNYDNWILNDLYTSDFLKAIKKVDINNLPESNEINKESFSYWANRNDLVSKVIEPRITFCGKGYKYGFSGDYDTHIGYRKEAYIKTIKAAKELLKDVDIQSIDIDNITFKDFNSYDFIYLDPPYYNENSPYGNIDHEKLLNNLKQCSSRWIISGYENELYNNLLGKPFAQVERKAEMQNLNHSSSRNKIESIWRNF